jgi:hypothetical protein
VGFARPERPGDAIAEIDDMVDMLRCEIGEHRFERWEIAMDIRDHPEPHGALTE